RDLRADRLDHARPLVTQHEGPVGRIAADAFDDVQVAVADARSNRAHHHLAAARRVHLHRLDRERLVHLVKDRGPDLHAWLSLRWRLDARLASAPGRRCGARSKYVAPLAQWEAPRG